MLLLLGSLSGQGVGGGINYVIYQPVYNNELFINVTSTLAQDEFILLSPILIYVRMDYFSWSFFNLWTLSQIVRIQVHTIPQRFLGYSSPAELYHIKAINLYLMGKDPISQGSTRVQFLYQ